MYKYPLSMCYEQALYAKNIINIKVHLIIQQIKPFRVTSGLEIEVLTNLWT